MREKYFLDKQLALMATQELGRAVWPSGQSCGLEVKDQEFVFHLLPMIV